MSGLWNQDCLAHRTSVHQNSAYRTKCLVSSQKLQILLNKFIIESTFTKFASYNGQLVRYTRQPVYEFTVISIISRLFCDITVHSICATQNYRCQNRKEYKGKTNSAQSALPHLLWLLYWPGSTHIPHMYPTPGWAWGMGVVRGCARAVPARPPSPPDSTLLRHSSWRQSYFEKTTM